MRKLKALRTRIQVWVTKTKRLRAKVKPDKGLLGFGEHGYEVTIGGEQWALGKGQEHKEGIKRQCELLLLRTGTSYAECFCKPQWGAKIEGILIDFINNKVIVRGSNV